MKEASFFDDYIDYIINFYGALENAKHSVNRLKKGIIDPQRGGTQADEALKLNKRTMELVLLDSGLKDNERLKEFNNINDLETILDAVENSGSDDKKNEFNKKYEIDNVAFSRLKNKTDELVATPKVIEDVEKELAARRQRPGEEEREDLANKKNEKNIFQKFNFSFK